MSAIVSPQGTKAPRPSVKTRLNTTAKADPVPVMARPVLVPVTGLWPALVPVTGLWPVLVLIARVWPVLVLITRVWPVLVPLYRVRASPAPTVPG